MKHASPKKSFSSFSKGSARSSSRGEGRAVAHASPRKSSDRPFKKGSSSSRPYEPQTRYGANTKSSSYRGKDFRGEQENKSEMKPVYAKQYTPRTFSSSPSSSPKSVYRNDERATYKGKDVHPFSTDRTTPRTSSRPSLRTATRSEYTKKDSYVPRSTTKESSSISEDKKLKASSQKLPTTPDTSWGGVADWYNKHLEKTDDSYHVKVIFPNILRMLGEVTGKKILDMACGQGIFADKLRDAGASVTGVDIGKELIKLAETRNESVKLKGTHKITYHVTSADDLYMLKDKSFDIVVCILAIQNIENLQKTIDEASRVLTEGGKMFLILNHPSFRNPKQTYWGYNEADDKQYRRVDEYMSESRVKIDMTPGSEKDKKFTVSFHRPLQVYVKALSKSGFMISRLEEWTSHKESEKGPKQRAENKARKEIPMFMCIEAKIGVRD